VQFTYGNPGPAYSDRVQGLRAGARPIAGAAGMAATCVRCGSTIERRTADSLHVTAACALAALALVRASQYPAILRIELYGASTENTALGRCDPAAQGWRLYHRVHRLHGEHLRSAAEIAGAFLIWLFRPKFQI